MDDLIQQLEQLTLDLLPRLDFASYEELALFVRQRQLIIDRLTAAAQTSPPTRSQKNRVAKLGGYDHMILEAIQRLKEEAGHCLEQRSRSKQQHRAYETAYAAEAILMDRRK